MICCGHDKYTVSQADRSQKLKKKRKEASVNFVMGSNMSWRRGKSDDLLCLLWKIPEILLWRNMKSVSFCNIQTFGTYFKIMFTYNNTVHWQLLLENMCTYPSARILSPLLNNFSLHPISNQGLYNGWRRVTTGERDFVVSRNCIPVSVVDALV